MTEIFYKNKYIKYKNKYIELLSENKKKVSNKILKGGMNIPIIETNDDSFLNDYTETMNYGQNNCGIYISNDKKKLIKCDLYKNSTDKLEKINLTYPDYLIFPKIYNYYLYNDSYFCLMDKFDGDLTQLMYEYLPSHVLDNMCNDNLIDENQKKIFCDIFNDLIPKTYNKYNKFNLSWSDAFTPLIEYLFLNRNELNEVDKIYNDDKIENKIYKGFTLDRWINYTINHFDNMVNYFINKQNFNFDKYHLFIKSYNKEYNKIINQIVKQIFKLKLLLKNIGLEYTDNKLDNFAFNLHNDKITHLGVDWKNNKIGDKYFYISIIDWSSGLFNSDDDILNQFNSPINQYSKYGQYNLTSIYGTKYWMNSPILVNYDKEKNSLNLTPDQIKLLTTFYTLDLKNPINDTFLNYEQVENYILQD
jgi:hypothetical protein